jgi:hypothetical protein
MGWQLPHEPAYPLPRRRLRLRLAHQLGADDKAVVGMADDKRIMAHARDKRALALNTLVPPQIRE